LLGCDNEHCLKNFCTTCVRRNFGDREVSKIVATDPWLCFHCIPGPLKSVMRPAAPRTKALTLLGVSVLRHFSGFGLRKGVVISSRKVSRGSSYPVLWLVKYEDEDSEEYFEPEINDMVRLAKNAGGSSSSAYFGVSRNRQKNSNVWVSRITVDGKGQRLGVFDSEEEAARRYDERAEDLGRPLNFLPRIPIPVPTPQSAPPYSPLVPKGYLGKKRPRSSSLSLSPMDQARTNTSERT